MVGKFVSFHLHHKVSHILQFVREPLRKIEIFEISMIIFRGKAVTPRAEDISIQRNVIRGYLVIHEHILLKLSTETNLTTNTVE